MASHPLINAKITRRRLTTLSLAGTAAVVVLPFRSHGALGQADVVMTMVTDTTGIGDGNFNDLANKGGTEAAKELGFTWRAIESIDASAYVPNLTAAAEQSELTVGVGAFLTDAITEVANQFSDKKFLFVDQVSDAGNVRSVTFQENEPAFLVGVVAGKVTKSNKIGIVGGQRIAPVIRYEVGFVAGVKSVNPAAEVSIAYVDSFGDPAKGKELAVAQIDQGADIIFPIAGGSGHGCNQAVAEKGEGYWIISGDTTQDKDAGGRELCVAQKGVDFVVYQGCRDTIEGKFEPTTVNYNLKSGGVSLQSTAGRVPEDVLALARGYEKLIVDGALVVPADDDQLKAFTPPPPPEPVVEASPAASPTA